MTPNLIFLIFLFFLNQAPFSVIHDFAHRSPAGVDEALGKAEQGLVRSTESVHRQLFNCSEYWKGGQENEVEILKN